MCVKIVIGNIVKGYLTIKNSYVRVRANLALLLCLTNARHCYIIKSASAAPTYECVGEIPLATRKRNIFCGAMFTFTKRGSIFLTYLPRSRKGS